MPKKHRRNIFYTRKTTNQHSNPKRLKSKVFITDIDAVFLKIDDINVDCLEHIFRLLDLADLFNVAEANMQLRAAAELVFNQKYEKMTVFLKNTKAPYDDASCGPISFSKDIDTISVQNLKYSFKILRVFGQYISEVVIRATDPSQNQSNSIKLNYDRIIRYLNKYCLESLIYFGVKFYLSNVLDGVRKEFKNVEVVVLHGGNITFELLLELNQKFPKMRRLVLAAYEFPNLNSIKFPYLDDLSMYSMEPKNICRSIVEPIISSNMDLRCLNLEHYDLNTWRMISTMRNLVTLGMHYTSSEFKNFTGPFISILLKISGWIFMVRRIMGYLKSHQPMYYHLSISRHAPLGVRTEVCHLYLISYLRIQQLKNSESEW